MKRWAVLFCVGVAMCVTASGASASGGAITRAIASPDWTTGSIAATVTIDRCDGGEQGCDYWAAVAALEPSSFQCPPDYAEERDVDFREIWSSGAQPLGATASFDFGEVPILSGIVGQQLCLYYDEPDRSQEASWQGVLATRALEVPQPPASPPLPPAPQTQASEPPAPAISPACTRARHEVERFRSSVRHARSVDHPKAATRWRKALDKALARRVVVC